MTLTPVTNFTRLRLAHHLSLTGGISNVSSKYILIQDTSRVTVGQDAIYSYSGDSHILSGGFSTLVEVDGTLNRVSGGSDATINSQINIAGLTHNQTGELRLRLGGTHSGIVLSDPGTTLMLRGPHDFLPSSSLIADHLLLDYALGGNTGYIRGTVDIASFIECVDHKWEFTSEANIVDYGPLLSVITGGLTFLAPTDRSIQFDRVTIGPSPPGETVTRVSFDTGQPINASTLGFYSGEFHGNSPINVSERFTWRNGNFFSGGDITVTGSAEIQDNNQARSVHRRLIIGGNATMLGGLALNNFNSDSRLDLLSSGVLELIGETNISQGGAIHNAGVLRKTGADEVSTFTVEIYNTGTVELLAGDVQLQQMDYVQTAGRTILNGCDITSHLFGPMRIEGGDLTGIGMADCDVDIDGGTMAPGLSTGELNIGGDYVQTASGTLEIEITSNGPGGFDVLTVGGTATLAGTIAVEAIDGYAPAVGDTFEVLTAVAVTGTFETVLRTGFPADKGIEVTYGPGSVTLGVIERSPGDCDEDGDIDLIDYACFFDCLTGPNVGLLPDCDSFDFNVDADVDLADFAEFERALTN
jgi:hypothetical protein